MINVNLSLYICPAVWLHILFQEPVITQEVDMQEEVEETQEAGEDQGEVKDFQVRNSNKCQTFKHIGYRLVLPANKVTVYVGIIFGYSSICSCFHAASFCEKNIWISGEKIIFS